MRNSSLPFLVAIADGAARRYDLDFTGSALNNPDVLAACEEVVRIADPAFDWKMNFPSGKVEIITRDGRRLAQIGTNVRAALRHP